MGSITTLYIKDYPILSSKNAVDPYVMSIFRETDRRVFKRRVKDRNPLVWGHSRSRRFETAYEYTCTVKQAKERLAVMGFTIERVEADFEKSKAGIIEKHQGDVDHFGSSSLWGKELALLENTSFHECLAIFREALLSGLRGEDFKAESSSGLAVYLIGDFELLGQFPCSDILHFVRAVLEACSDADLVTQELTDVVQGGWHGEDEAIADNAIESLTEDYPIHSKIIILAEGSTDISALQATLKLLYPHLYDYYSFMDFAGSNAMGSAAQLTATVKAFAGSGIANRIIAIFDNDTAGLDAMRGLGKTNVPENIKVIRYPDIELASNYPTLGPTGISSLNINGLACSIELYFGADTLKLGKQLEPVQWKGYIDGVKQYQGEVLRKKELQEAFAKKLAECSTNPALISHKDWSGIRAIWETIFRAFH